MKKEMIAKNLDDINDHITSLWYVIEEDPNELIDASGIMDKCEKLINEIKTDLLIEIKKPEL